jgi:FkbM family methyltransferase
MSLSAKFRTLVGLLETAGMQGAYRYYRNRLSCSIGRPRTGTFLLQPKGIRHPIALRAGASSDTSVFKQIFIEQEYQLLYATPNVNCILDLGANTGLSAICFLAHFPHAQVVAVEPDAENYRLCEHNLAAYGARVRAIQGAAWSQSGKLALTRIRDGRDWAVAVMEPTGDAPGVVEAWDVPALFSMAGFETVDLLKIDVERSEIEIFNHNSSAWIERVRNLCIELHGPDCEEAFFGAMANFEYELEHSGELVVCRNIRPARKN